MTLIICDSIIWIDALAGELVVPMFELGYQFAVPDGLYSSELEAMHGDLLSAGLKTRTISIGGSERLRWLARKYTQLSDFDVMALTLALEAKCILLTGDARLRKAAEQEKVEVKGTLWLVSEMVSQERITISVARKALQKMKLRERRLPWEAFEQMLNALEKDITSKR